MKNLFSNITNKLRNLSRKTKIFLGVFIVLMLWFWLSLPRQLFQTPTSFVIEDEKGNLLSAGIAPDGQWRFPNNENVPEKFIKCITTFEDKRFYYHPGVDPVAMGRAVIQNIRGKQVVSGGSTLTMQVIRLSRKKERTFLQKLKETILAVRLECSFSKNEILGLYASNAPFGSNVVGLDAAAWRYYGRGSDKLSWGEMAALAVLPNAPSLVHPGKNRNTLLRKRNALIDKLVANKTIDLTSGELAKMEPLPGQPLSLPQLTPHLLDRFKKEYKTIKENRPEQSTRIVSTINADLQQNVIDLINRYHNGFRANGVNNAAAMVMEIETGNVLAYVGNVYKVNEPELESHVDVLAAPRSPGSTLKPILFAALQNDGQVLPRQLIPDIPIQIGGYTPQNFNLEYDGAVPANNAISRSLNIPAVKMLQAYKAQRFYDVLQQCGFTTIKQPASHYGLSLILGGCEVTPWELAGVYSSMARVYLNQRNNKGKILSEDWHMPKYFKTQPINLSTPQLLNLSTPQLPNSSTRQPLNFLDHTSLWHAFNAMNEVMRPGEEGIWNVFTSAQRIAWKTGTSFGFRDAWAIGFTPKYCVVVWVGNTDGEGRPELTGINTAAPVLFDIFRMLPTSPWFEPPGYDFTYLPVCHKSGYKAGADCEKVDTVLVSVKGKNAPPCPYHRIIHLDKTGVTRVTESCESPSAMVHKSWFILPPTIEYYYKRHHHDYKPLPEYAPGCNTASLKQIDIIYPEENARIYIPLEFSGEKGKTIVKATHRQANAKLFWHLDGEYIGTTVQFHHLGINPAPGFHTLTVVDEKGESNSRKFEIQQKEK